MDDGGDPVPQAELHQNPREMPGHGLLGEGEGGGDLVVPQPAADRGEHLAFMVGEGVGVGDRGTVDGDGGGAVGGDGRRHRCSPDSGRVGLAGAVEK
ncbi:hypothetical protein [Streptomyces cavourensis]|uniref:hypothetical protein n=1 Tax=Streptomyces cavourensis TaxID=67258 RepID=UPI0020CA0AEF|nr:hypothetical protein [Streptomyces cavourensis]